MECGAVVLHKKTGQYRLAVVPVEESRTPYSFNPSPSTLSYFDSRANAGEFGPEAQQTAKDKLEAWANTYDTKAVCICAGKVRRPV
jgi:hypothetical protein